MHPKLPFEAGRRKGMDQIVTDKEENSDQEWWFGTSAISFSCAYMEATSETSFSAVFQEATETGMWDEGFDLGKPNWKRYDQIYLAPAEFVKNSDPSLTGLRERIFIVLGGTQKNILQQRGEKCPEH